jgi:hypothetical protein
MVQSTLEILPSASTIDGTNKYQKHQFLYSVLYKLFELYQGKGGVNAWRASYDLVPFDGAGKP